MKSRNTAPRLSIDFGPGYFPQPNKSDISALKSWLCSWQVSSFQPPCPCSKVTSFLGSGQIQRPHTCPWSSGCPAHPSGWFPGRFQLCTWRRAKSRCPLIKWGTGPARRAELGLAERRI